jgi:hypothetical protein
MVIQPDLDQIRERKRDGAQGGIGKHRQSEG